MRIIACLLFIGAMSSLSNGQHRWQGRISGDEVFISLTADALAAATRWDPSDPSNPPPPIPVEKALKLAREALELEHPTLRGTRWGLSFQLSSETSGINDRSMLVDEKGNCFYRDDEPLTIVLDSWVYWIRFTNSPLAGGSIKMHLSPSIPVAVLMDGTVLLPKKERFTVDTKTFEKSYRKMLIMPYRSDLPAQEK
jgi:hypothetical protein